MLKTLKLQAALQVIEIGEYELADLLRAVAEPVNNNDFALAEVAHDDDDFSLLIDAKYCEGELTTCRFDVSPNKRRLFIEGFAERRAYVYVSERYISLNPQVHKIDETPVVGQRIITRRRIADDLYIRDPFVTTNEAGLRMTHEALEIKNLEPEKGCRGFAVAIGYYSDASEAYDSRPRTIILFNEEDTLRCYDSLFPLIVKEIHRTYFEMNGPNSPKLSSQVIDECLRMRVDHGEDQTKLSVFSDDGSLRFSNYHLCIDPADPNTGEIAVEIFVEISQLKF